MGVSRAELLDAVFAEQVDARIVGKGHKRAIQVWTADLVKRWPAQFSEFSDPPARAREERVFAAFSGVQRAPEES